MNGTVGLAQSHDLFLAHVNRQFLCRKTERGGEREGERDGARDGGGAGIALNESQSNHSSIWMI